MAEKENPMRNIYVERLVINIGSGGEEKTFNNAKALLELITKRKPSPAFSKKRNPAFKITKGQRIGAFVTVRGKEIDSLTKRLLDAFKGDLENVEIVKSTLQFSFAEPVPVKLIERIAKFRATEVAEKRKS